MRIKFQAQRLFLLMAQVVQERQLYVRHKHIRASLCHNVNSARMTRKHNDSNVICLQGRPFVKKKIFAMLDAYFDTEFEEGRHIRRVEQL